MFLPVFVYLSVCWQDYSKTPAWIWMKCCVLTDVGTDPDHSPDCFLQYRIRAATRNFTARR